MTKMDLVKSDVFVQNAYLILIVLVKSAIFAVFAENGEINAFLETPLVFTVFHCSRVVRFSHGFW